MSFDLYAINGDIELGRDGDVQQITDSDKLAQDVIKLLNTTLESDPLNPGYGSLLTASRLGTPVVDPEGLITEMQAILVEALDRFIQLQEQQATYQDVSDAETIVDFETPIVEIDPQEPRQFNVIVNALSRDLTPVTIAFVARF